MEPEFADLELERKFENKKQLHRYLRERRKWRMEYTFDKC